MRKSKPENTNDRHDNHSEHEQNSNGGNKLQKCICSVQANFPWVIFI